MRIRVVKDTATRRAIVPVVLLVTLYLLGGLLGLVVGGSYGIAAADGAARAAAGPAALDPAPLFPPPGLTAPLVSSGSNVYYVGAQAPTSICNPTCTYLTNTGARTTVQVITTQVTGCLSYWIGDDSAANVWAQVGYYICNGATPLAFYQIWNLTSGAVLTTGTTSVSTGSHTFSLYVQSGTTWAFALDGSVFGTYDLGASLSLGTYPVQAVSEEGLVSGPWTPPEVTFFTAIQTLQTASTFPAGNGWIAAPSAFDPWGGCTSTGSVNNTGGYTCWGLAGNLQDATIQANSIVTGGSRALLRAGTSLWNGATADFTLSASPASVTTNAGSAGTSTVTVASLAGFAGTVALTISVSPATGLSCTLTPSSIAGGSGTSTLSCTGSAGTYAVTVTGTSGSLSHSTSVSFTVTGGITLTFSFTVQGGGTGYAAPTLTYVQGGATKSATLTSTATAFTVDSGSAWSVTNPLSGSSATERWRTPQAASGTATSSLTVLFTYYHQVTVTFAYSVQGGGSGYSSPTVSYGSFGAAASTATGASVWADVGSTFALPAALPGSTGSEGWRTNNPSGTISASATLTVAFYHQFDVPFGYTILGGGSGYAAPTVTATQFGVGVSLAAATAWVDAGTAYAFTNPLAGSGATQRWSAASSTGTVNSAAGVTVAYYHQYQDTFAFTVLGGGSGYTAPSVGYTSLGVSSSTATGIAVWADAGTGYAFTNPLGGSTSTAAWRSGAAVGSVTGAGTVSATYYYQFFVAFLVQVLNGNLPSTMPSLTATVFGSTTSITAGGSSWVDAGGSYAYPATFAGAPGERWISANPASGTVSLSATITASYFDQDSVTFSYAVTGGGSGYGAPSVTYTALGASQATSAGTTVWVDAGSAYVYAAGLTGGSSSERWVTASPGGTVTGPGTLTVTYVHQLWLDFSFTVKGGGSGYSAPSVTYTNLSVPRSVLAVTLWVWADAGTAYAYQNPLPGSTSTNSWQTNNGAGTVGSSATYTATYRHQYKVKFSATTLAGTQTPQSPEVNVTVFGTNVTLAADNVTWVDAGGIYSFPGVFYGPLPGERWITATPPSGLVLGPMNITATYAHQYYLAIQINAAQGGTVSGLPGWYDEAAAMTLRAAAEPGWQFQGWIGSGSGSYTGSSTTANIALDAPVTETAVFYVGLTLSASNGGSLRYAYGGTTGWVPGGSTETLYLAPGTNVSVEASPSLFYQLDGWSGSSGGSRPTVVLVANAPQTLTATYGLSLYSKVDSLLGLAVVGTALLALALAVRRRRRKRKERAVRLATMRARARA